MARPIKQTSRGFAYGVGTNLFAVVFCLPILAYRHGIAVPYVPMTCAFIVLMAPVAIAGIVFSGVDIVKRRRQGWAGLLLCLTCLPLYFVLSDLLLKLLALNDD